jgi:energy-coupling factor transporter transmembrane protein EcfT
MRTTWHAIWGCAQGPVVRLAPHIRILVGVCLFLSCMIAPTAHAAGAGFAMAVSALWLGTCWPHGQVLRPVLLFGLTALLSYAVVTFLVALAVAKHDSALFATTASLLVGGATTLLVSLGTISALSMSDLRAGLVRLPVPKIVAAILLQIVHQTTTLAYETRRMAAAMAVRGSASGGLVAWKLLSSLPRVWLPRIVRRADRVTAAMELRGYCDLVLGAHEKRRHRFTDLLALGFAVAMIAVALLLRFRTVQW